MFLAALMNNLGAEKPHTDDILIALVNLAKEQGVEIGNSGTPAAVVKAWKRLRLDDSGSINGKDIFRQNSESTARLIVTLANDSKDLTEQFWFEPFEIDAVQALFKPGTKRSRPAQSNEFPRKAIAEDLHLLAGLFQCKPQYYKANGKSRIVGARLWLSWTPSQIRCLPIGVDFKKYNVPLFNPLLTGTDGSYVGRTTEVDELSAMIARIVNSSQKTSRLISVVGPPGAGKSRFAVEAVKRLPPTYLKHIWIADLGATSCISLESLTAIPFASETEPLALAALLRAAIHSARAIVLLLDSAERQADAVARFVAHWRGRVAGGSVINIGQHILGFEDEYIVPLLGLDGPLPDTIQDPENLLTYDSTKLFCQRALLAWKEFRPTPDDARGIIQICRLLDGLPLAIEIAASKLRVMTIPQLLEGISRSTEILQTTFPAAVERHHSLAAAIEWSLSLLDRNERALFMRLSIFPEGFTLEQLTEAIGDMSEAAMIHALEGLVTASLVLRIVNRTEATFRMLTVLREYALERLILTGGDPDALLTPNAGSK
ncbi:MAG: hypothetical protein BroJett014_15670 [Planctomycetota bacterium]|nr:MAG: hypothetical protein BroJett014_15670 [Planctomycetota bacterium]